MFLNWRLRNVHYDMMMMIDGVWWLMAASHGLRVKTRKITNFS